MELAVVAEVLGRAAAPGPWGTTALVAAVVAECGAPELAKELLPGLVDGSLPATLAVPTAPPPTASAVPPAGLTGSVRSRRLGLQVSGSLGPLLNGAVGRPGAGPGGHRRRGALGAGGGRTGGADRAAAQLRPLPAVGTLDRRRRWRCPPTGCWTRTSDRAHPGPGPGGRGRRGVRRRPLVPRHRGRARPDPPPVRSAHRPVPGGQAPAGRHAGGGGAGGGGHLGRRLRSVDHERSEAGTAPRPGWPSNWPRRWPWTATWRRPRGPSRSSGAWASPGSTTPTSTSAGPPPSASSSGAPPRSGPRRPGWPWRAGAGG